MWRALQRLWPYVTSARHAMLAGVLWIVLATAISLTAPLILKYVIDDLLAGATRATLALAAAALLGLAIADGVCRYWMRQRLIGASRAIEYALRNDFFAHLQRLPLSYYQANRIGDLMSRASSDLGAVRLMVGPAVMYFGSTALGFVIAVALMVSIDPWLTLLALIPLPLVSIATHVFGKAIHEKFDRIQAQLSELSAVVQESLAGVRVVRAYRQEPFELSRFGAANDEYVHRNRSLIRLQSAFYPSLSFFFGLSGLVVLWFGGSGVINGRITLGDFAAFSRYLVLLSWPLIAFGWVINIVQRGIASWQRMLEVMDTVPAITDAEADPAALAGRVVGRLEVRHLSFTYPGATQQVLTDISFSASPGQTVAIVGATGSGKSTLLQLVPRLHDPPPGTVFLDGVDIRRVPLERLRRAMGVVPQEPFLFSDTVAHNIAFSRDGDPPKDAVAAAASAAGLDADVSGFGHGFDTMVGERGITLSGGQKQRAAIARALLVDPKVLILDDALSAVDTTTEDAILRRLRDVRETRTCLLVAHRISTVRDADLILVLDGGRVIERGTHTSLVAQGGVYASMDRRQRLEQELAAS
ncbi:MAG: ABC transporter ATP-binding protein [Acidimicrobiia bacterium]|nr:ABC transporter ATP-binding protein [Acidimicrobiia bacterium]